jgi:metallo-beta-lactamase class B
VVFPCCTGVNPGYRLVVLSGHRRWRTFRMLESMKPDIWLPAHTQTPGYEDKLARAPKEGVQARVDPDGYRRWLSEEKAKFEVPVAKEK